MALIVGILQVGKQREAQIDDFAHRAQVEQTGAMSLETLLLGAGGLEVEKLALGIGKDGSSVIAAQIPEEQGHNDGSG